MHIKLNGISEEVFENTSVVENTGIAQFTTQQEMVGEGSLVVVPRINPFPDETPEAILSREIFLFSFAYSASAGRATKENLWGFFRQNAVMKQYFTKWTYFSCDGFEIRFENMQNKSLCGLLYTGHYPWQKFSGNAIVFTEFRQMINYNFTIIDLAEPGSCVLRVPFVAGNDWIPLGADLWPSTFWLQTSAISDAMAVGASGRMQVFARIINPRVSIIHPASYAATEVVHNAMVQNRADWGITASTAGLAMTAFSVNQLATTASNIFSSLQTAYSSYKKASKATRPNSLASEEPVKAVRPDPVGSICSQFQADAVYMGDVSGFIIDPGRFAQKSVRHSISELIQRPAYLTSITLSTGGTRWFTGDIFPSRVHDFANQTFVSQINSWVGFMSQYFRYWRGSFVFYMVIPGNPFIDRRLSVWFTKSKPATDTSVAPDTGSAYVSHHNFSGTQVLKITVPYCYGSLVQMTPGNLVDLMRNVYVCIQHVGSFTSGMPSSVPMDVVLFGAAGPDMMFYEPRNPLTGTAAPVNIELPSQYVEHQSLATNVKEVDASVGTHKFMSVPYRTVTDYEDLMTIPTFRHLLASAQATYPIFPSSVADFTTLSQYDILGSCFLYVRGSMKARYVQDTVTQTPLGTMAAYLDGFSYNKNANQDLPPLMNSSTVGVKNVNNVLSWEAPLLHTGYAYYWADFSYDGLDPEPPAVMNLHEPGISNTTNGLVSAGRYFQGFCLFSPPDPVMWPANSTP